MAKRRRNVLDKLNTLFFGKDLRVTEGEPYTEIREFDFSSYYPEDKYIYNQNLPTENVFDIRDYGADVSCDDNAPFINKAVLDASRAGGTVLISGGDFISGTVTLKSDVTFFIAKDSSITARADGKGFEEKKTLIFAENENNIVITGGGRIKCNGHLYGRKPVADKNNTTPAKYIDVIEMRQDYRSQLRFAHPSKYGGPVSFKNCNNITVNNFIIENSAYWTFKLSNCENVIIRNFIINNNRNVANADGIDLAGTSNVDISHCFISTADDGIVIKNAVWLGNNNAMSNIKITDCEVISRTNAIKVGTETTFDISDITVTDCRLFMTDLYPGSVSGISLEACDGTALSNIRVHNISMDRCTCPIFIRLGNRNRASLVNTQSANAIEFGAKAQKGGELSKKLFDGKSSVSDIIITDVKATGVELPIIIAGYKQNGKVKRVENVTLKNIELEYVDIPETIDRRAFIPEYTKEYPEGWRFRNLPAYALWIRHATNISLENFTCLHPQKTWKKDIIKEDVL
ncbi:MAG: right-handed parallel beta-helix repeat-containing protein [Eubacterium sp.]|nr:right-handed parallel beta-helix repeat-containing protein [Eubacterium sp.]